MLDKALATAILLLAVPASLGSVVSAHPHLEQDKDAAKRGDKKAMDRVTSYYTEGGPSSSAERMEWCIFAANKGSAFAAQLCADESLKQGRCRDAEAWYRRANYLGRSNRPLVISDDEWIAEIHKGKFKCNHSN
ncbi:MAG TPA: hypothetical protein VG407_17225 [Caulobacteraceae bacterium]|jgi:hypothetical protein|nr:hypothetical protein [Caulobacteraceae bacterium]